jgi:hypothetical protein
LLTLAPSSVIVGFNYGNLPEAAAEDLRATAKRIRRLQQRSVSNLIEIGKELIGAKARLKHGQFYPWLMAEFGMSVRSAQRFMAVAERLDGKCDESSYLPAETAFALAACDDPVRTGLIERLKRGEILRARDVRAMNRAAQRAHHQLNHEQAAPSSPENSQKQSEWQSREQKAEARRAAANEAALLIEHHIGGRRGALLELLAKTTGPHLHQALLAALSGQEQRRS